MKHEIWYPVENTTIYAVCRNGDTMEISNHCEILIINFWSLTRASKSVILQQALDNLWITSTYRLSGPLCDTNIRLLLPNYDMPIPNIKPSCCRRNCRGRTDRRPPSSLPRPGCHRPHWLLHRFVTDGIILTFVWILSPSAAYKMSFGCEVILPVALVKKV